MRGLMKLTKISYSNQELHSSKNLDFHRANVKRIENTKQSVDIIPTLANNLDKILNIQGKNL